MKFRPVNNCVPEDHKEFESFIYGNGAGIYQSKYGLHSYEFCYLRHSDIEAKIVGLSNEKKKANASSGDKVAPAAPEDESKKYEILDRFTSNGIQIGTFNVFMNITCDQALIGPNRALNLSWIIYGVAYSILSNPKCRNCVGFYKVEGSEGSSCAKIEIIPTSAYLQVDDNEPCPGRMVVVSPSEPGIYEIRFLFNFFKKAQLHRQCQVFGELEDQMQQLRIRSFYEKRAVIEELRKFSAGEPQAWGIARMHTFTWLKSMLLSTLREPVKNSVMESTTDYSDFLFSRLKRNLQRGLENPSRVFQKRLACIISPLCKASFMQVLMVALSSNSQVNDQLASITFMSPTDEDIKNFGNNPDRDLLFLPTDRSLFLGGPVSQRLFAINYLNQKSLCGYHDFVDDIVLNHEALLDNADQVMNNLSSGCVALYESAILHAVEEMMVEARQLNLENVLQGVDVMLIDLCRNHVQSIIRSFIETDCRTGKRWPGPKKETLQRMLDLRSGVVEDNLEIVVGDEIVNTAPQSAPGGEAPVTRQHIALRRWIRPKLASKIVKILKTRYARLLAGNLPIISQMVISCYRPGLSLAGNPFPSYRMNTTSPLYFLAENPDSSDGNQAGGQQGIGADANMNQGGDDMNDNDN